ncbi:MAG: IS1634 family transposase [Pseudomonadota bacterium]
MTTIQKKPSRGHTYWQIVESRRVNGKPRPIVIMHLGTAESLLRRLREGPGKAIKAKVIKFGAIAALWNLAQELGVVEIIDKHIPKRNQGLSCGEYILLAALNRCVAATSKKSLYQWYCKTVLRRLLPTSQRSLASQRFWDHMSYLDENSIAAIEEELTARLIDHFKIDLRTLLFDATNFDTYIDTQNPSTLPQRGHPKSKRKDLRILGLALLVSMDFHVPLFSHVYPGNQNDAAMFSSVTESLVARYRKFAEECEQITLVFDGGNTSKDAMEEIDDSDYHFITSLTVTYHKDLLSVPLRRFEAFDDPRLDGTTAYRTKKDIWGEERTVVVTRSQNLLTGQLAGISVALRKKRAKLRQLRTKLHRSQQPGAKGKGYTRESLQKRLKEITTGQYISEILKTKIAASKSRLDFTFWTDAAAFDKLKRTRLGKRILCTDNHDWSTEEIILGSRAQSRIEDAFKRMKDPHWVSFSPSFHWTDQKLRVHAFYCVIALTFSSLLQRKAAQAGIKLTIPSLLEQLSNVEEIINLYPPQTGQSRGRLRAEYVLSERSPLQDELCKIFDLFKLAHP